jgi:hypothetical protein
VASTFAAPDETHALKKIERTLTVTSTKYRVRPTGDDKAARNERHVSGGSPFRQSIHQGESLRNLAYGER